MVDLMIHRFHYHDKSVRFINGGDALQQLNSICHLKIPGKFGVRHSQYIVNEFCVHPFSNVNGCADILQDLFPQAAITTSKRYIFKSQCAHKLSKLHPQSLDCFADLFLLLNRSVLKHGVFPCAKSLIMSPFNLVQGITASYVSENSKLGGKFHFKYVVSTDL